MILNAFKGFIISLSMFTVIPMPNLWTGKQSDEGALRFVAPLLPLVGLVIGALWYFFTLAVILLNDRLSLNGMLAAALILLFPQALGGFIHMDGFMDTSDAVFSFAPLDKKREILKDSRVGAFGAIALAVYLLIGFAAATEITRASLTDNAVLLFVPAVARGVSASYLLNAKAMSETGLGAVFRQGATFATKGMPALFCTVFITTAWSNASLSEALPLIVTAVSGILAMKLTIRQLGGVSGDLCGFSITLGELCGFVTFCVLKGVGA